VKRQTRLSGSALYVANGQDLGAEFREVYWSFIFLSEIRSVRVDGSKALLFRNT
jgi:hypothetical protein